MKQRQRFRVGNLEREILRVLAEVEETDDRPKMSRSRRGRVACIEWKKIGQPHVPLIWIRNSIFRSRYCRDIKASDKANFSRAVKSLEEKGLIRTCNWGSDEKRYRTHAALTEAGAAFLLHGCKELTRKEASP